MRNDASNISLSDESLADALHHVAIHLLRLVRSEDPSSGLTPSRLSALSVVVFAGPISLRDLAAAEGVRPPTMTKLVQALVEANLVRRLANKDDARVVLIEATEVGQEVLLAAKRRRIAKLAASLNRISYQDREALSKGIKVMVRMIEGDENSP